MKKLSLDKYNFICFIGIDGSGKTANAEYLVKVLNKKGFEFNYVYGRYEPFILKPFIFLGRKIFLRNENLNINYSNYSNKKKKSIKKNKHLASLFYKMMIFDYLLQIFIKFRIPLFFGKKIICDRYIYDTVITDISVAMELAFVEIKKLLNKSFLIAPTPDLTFLIDLSEELAFKRKDDIPAIEYLRELRNIYLNLGKEEKMIILDGSKPLNEIQDNIKNSLKI